MAMSARLARLRTAAWLGWQVESNWADPVLFLIYVVARPLAVSLMLVAMYRAVRTTAMAPALFAGFYVANAFHAYADRLIIGLGWAVFEEREEYETLKYVVVSPTGLFTYLVGRSGVKYTMGTASVLITLLVGWFGLGVRWDWTAVRVAPLLVSLALGLVSALALGLLVAGVGLLLTRRAILVFEGVTIALYLLCGVIFPVSLLPPPLQAVSFALPLTWWYEALRRFLVGLPPAGAFARLSDAALLAGFAFLTAAFLLFARWGFRAFETRARRLGRIDQTTLY
jgi:ABC-2 type transport system permease protein